MGILDKALFGGAAALIGVAVRSIYREAQETKRRKSSPLNFDNRLSQQDFIDISCSVASRIRRVVEVKTTGMTVVLEVRSNSGLTTWKADVDFNDYGRLTGNYWLSSENDQSPIPEYFAKELQREIEARVAETM